MIDIQREEVVSLTDAARLAILPKRRRGKKLSPSTLYRWSKYGIDGTQLETIRVGGTLCTSAEALQRFFDRLSGERNNAPPSSNSNASIEAEQKLSELRI